MTKNQGIIITKYHVNWNRVFVLIRVVGARYQESGAIINVNCGIFGGGLQDS